MPAAEVDSDGDGIGDNSDPYPDDPANQARASCGDPTFDNRSDRGTFLWQDCDGSDRWHLRVSGGGTSTSLTFDGRFSSPGGVAVYEPYSIEGNDVLDDSDPTALAYVLRVYNNGADGINFIAGADTCFTPDDNNLPVYVGADRKPMMSSDLSLDDLAAYAAPADSDADGLSDEDEASLGTDPLDPSDD
ncbi:hypothetical protein BH24PSE2_BH24PSE2_21260 [soil metagenome]